MPAAPGPSGVLPPRVLSIAGSDSGGGAGIQADLKAFARCGVHGMTAITAVTAQNTRAVTAVYPMPPDAIVEQVRAVAEDIGVDAVKIGMLGNAETIRAVERALDLVPRAPVVLDPVMIAESGARLLDETAEEALRIGLLPRATVVTPNLSEAAVLAGAESAAVSDAAARARDRPAAGPEVAAQAGRDMTAGPEGGAQAGRDMTAGPEGGAQAGRDTAARPETGAQAAAWGEPESLARSIRALGPSVVVVTGGHRDEATDLYFDGERLVEIPGGRYPDGASHGSGCTHSSALAAHLALGADPLVAARRAKQIASEAVRDGLRGLGAGAGPVDVFGIVRG
jgi:hydroxymethylpyrimidine/phosphomethylpyrimidine kinase